MIAYNDMMMNSLSTFKGNLNERLYQQLEEYGYMQKSLSEKMAACDYNMNYHDTFKRSIMNFNGTQYGELSEQVVLGGDFEIEMDVYPGAGSLQTLLSLRPNTAHFLRITNISNTPSISFRPGIGEKAVPCPDLVPRKIQKLLISRQADTVVVHLDGVLQGSNSDPSWETPFILDTVAAIGSLNQFLTGYILSLRVWENGDKNTGTPVPGLGNIKFNKAGSDYQRDYSVDVETGLLGNNLWDTPDDYSNGEILVNTTNRVTVKGSSEDGGTRVAKHLGYSFSPGAAYRVSGNVTDSSESLVMYIREGSSAGVGTVVSDSGVLVTGEKFEFIFTATSADHNILISKASDAEIGVEGLGIETFSGVTLKNSLPGDWESIEKEPSWNYWLGSTNLSNRTSVSLPPDYVSGNSNQYQYWDLADNLQGIPLLINTIMYGKQGTPPLGWSTQTGVPASPDFRYTGFNFEGEALLRGIHTPSTEEYLRVFCDALDPLTDIGFKDIYIRKYFELVQQAIPDPVEESNGLDSGAWNDEGTWDDDSTWSDS